MSRSDASPTRHRPRSRLIAGLLGSVSALSLLASGAAANPQGGTVASGTATISQTAPDTLEVHQTSDKAIINWQSFSIGTGEHTHFRQPGAAAIALNRVTGGDPSQILGRLTATGQIILVNPNGILFGRTATIDVAGLVATTSNIRDQDFLTGRLEFTQPGSPGSAVVNRGTITIRDGGLAALVAPGVENSGHIVARLGRIALASGDRFTVDLYGDGLINLTMDEGHTTPAAADGEQLTDRVRNSGVLSADGGHVVLATATVRDIVNNTINMDGVVEARSFAEQDGRITLFGGETGEVRVAGRLDTTATSGQGGNIDVFGQHIVATDDALINAAGETGGGNIRVGGDVRGQTPSLASTTTTVADSATIRADARARGNGGQIVVWSDGTTAFSGTASARGGPSDGDGGFIEVSGKQALAFAGQADTHAPHGNTGQLLLDPTSIDICSGCTTGGAGTANSQLNVNDLVTNLNTNNVTVSTNSAAAGDGDIDVNARIRWSSGNNLTLEADRDINVQQNIEARAQSDVTLAAGRNVEMTAGRRLTTIGGNTNVSGEQVTLQRIQTRGNGTSANGGSLTVNATGDVTLAQPVDARGSIPLGGTGGAVSITATGDIAVAGSIHTSARGGNAGDITLTSQNGAVLTADNALLNARGENGGDGGDVTVKATNGLVRIGTTNRAGTRIDARSLVSGTAGGNVTVSGATVILNRDISSSAGMTGSAGQVTINAVNDLTTRSIGARGGRTSGQGGNTSISAGGNITATGAIDTAGYTGNSGTIDVSSTGGDITSEDNASFRSYALQGGNGGAVTLEANAGTITLGRNLGRGTRIDTRGRGAGATGNGGDVTVSAQNVALNRDVNAGGSVGGDGGTVTVTASSGDASLRSIAARGGTTAGQGGTINVTATDGDITVHGNVDVNAYTGNAGTIALQSIRRSIAMRDTAFLNARGLRGGNGGTIGLTATNGDITVGDTTRNSTHILTGASGPGAAGNGGDIALNARSVTLNRGIGASGATGGNGGDVTVMATAGTITTRGIAARGGTTAGQGGDITVSASADVTVNGSVDVAGYTGKAGSISVTSSNGAIASSDNAAFRAQGRRGGNGGNVTFNAANRIELGQTLGNGARIDTRGLGPGAAGNGGDVSLTAQAVTLNRAVHTSGATNGNAGRVTVNATNGAASIRGITARGGTTNGQGGQINVTATGDISTNGNMDASATAGNAGSVSLISEAGSILTGDRASIAARGQRGGNAGSISMTAAADIRIGASAGGNTQLLANAAGAGSSGNGGSVTLRGQNVTLNRNISVAGAPQGNGGSVSVTATNGEVSARTIAARGGTTSGEGGTIGITATSDISLNTTVDASGYAANAGSISVTSSSGSITSADRATISARGIRDGNGGTIAMQANNGDITVGASVGGGARITTRSNGAAGTGTGGSIQLQAGTVTLNRSIETRGGATGGAATITANAGSALLRNVDTRGSGTNGNINVSATGSVTSTGGTLRGGGTTIDAAGPILANVSADSLLIGGDSAEITGRINGQSRAAAVNELQIDNTNIPDPCTVNGIACILPPPPPPPVPESVVALTTDVGALTAAIDQAESPLPLRVAEQETPGQEAFVQSPLIDAVPVDVFSGGYQLVTTGAILPAAGENDEANTDDEETEAAEANAADPGNEPIVPSAGPAPDNAAPVTVDPYFTQDLWSGVRNP